MWCICTPADKSLGTSVSRLSVITWQLHVFGSGSPCARCNVGYLCLLKLALNRYFCFEWTLCSDILSGSLNHLSAMVVVFRCPFLIVNFGQGVKYQYSRWVWCLLFVGHFIYEITLVGFVDFNQDLKILLWGPSEACSVLLHSTSFVLDLFYCPCLLFYWELLVGQFEGVWRRALTRQ